MKRVINFFCCTCLLLSFIVDNHAQAGLIDPIRIDRELLLDRQRAGGPVSGLWALGLGLQLPGVVIGASQQSNMTPQAITFDGQVGLLHDPSVVPLIPARAQSWFTARFSIAEVTLWRMIATVVDDDPTGTTTVDVTLRDFPTQQSLASFMNSGGDLTGVLVPGTYELDIMVTAQSGGTRASGNMRYDLSFTVPTPSTTALGLVACAFSGRRRRRSFAPASHGS